MRTEIVKYLIIGAGVSGLSFANHVNDYLIVEKENEIGGYCRTIKSGEYVWDYAGHFFHFNNEIYKNLFLKSLKKEDIVFQEKCTKIYYNGLLIDYPFQKHIHQLPKDEFIDCLYDLFNKEEKENYNNFLDMLYGKFGKSITEKFLKPYNEKLYACDLSNLDTDAMGRFFPYADKEDIIRNMKNSKDISYNNIFLYPKSGAETFMNILYSSLDKNKILLNTEITKIDMKNKIAFTKNMEIHYQYLINTSPLNKFLNLLGQDYNNLEKKLSYNKVLVFNLGFDKKSIYSKEHWLYFPEKDINFYRVGFYDNILMTNKLSMYIEIGYAKDDNIDDKEIEKQLKLTLANLQKVGIISKDFNLVAHSTIIMNPAYVHIESSVEKEIKKLFSEFEENNIYSIGRYGAWTYCSMEDCMIEAKNLSENI